ncbi:hypothetical protein NC653_009299 [Populus alba x Populus x berolinensis]|uniref:Uncharacterized protein n=1 Tax=Populus alba x Populus x berolinensis TaxID=444605 RepID=A0AAD6R911_9ROSI|nr:hypothetical protein NC653_009299 [Populus alba x Populus x berolinensis]
MFCRIYFNYSIASANVHLIAFFYLFVCVCVCVSMKFQCTSGQMEKGGCTLSIMWEGDAIITRHPFAITHARGHLEKEFLCYTFG